MTTLITSRADYAVGQTLDISLETKTSPFSDETQIKFNDAYDIKLKDSKISNQGECDIYCSLVQDESQKAKALGVSGKLDFSYGPVSGDANVKFAMDNTQGSLDLTMIIRAHQNGRIIKNDLNELIKLKLRPSVVQKIKDDKDYTINDFKKDYGSYLIFGFDYGGQILFQSTYSTNSSQDKMSVGGGLSVSFGKMGFNISGSVKGDYKSDDIKKSTNISTKYTIKPSFDSDLINGDEGIIELLTKISDPISNGLAVDNNDENKENGDIGNMQANLYSKIQRLLGGETLDAVNAVIYSMESIGCVTDAFLKMEEPKFKIQSFFKVINPLYMSMKQMLKGIITMNINYDKYDKDNKPTEIIEWLKLLQNNINKMQIIDGKDLYTVSEQWYDFIESDEIKQDDDNDNDKQEIEKDFYKINKNVLEEQFKTKLFNKYNEMITKFNITKDLTGFYKFENINSKKVIDVSGSSKNDYAPIIQYEEIEPNQFNQIFFVEKVKQKNDNDDEQYYYVKNIYSHKVWDIFGSKFENGTKLIQYEQSNDIAFNQQFAFIPSDINNGAYVIKVRHSGLFIDVPGASMLNAVQLQQYHRNKDEIGIKAQEFYLKKQ